MIHVTVQIIREEHAAFAAVLRGMQNHVAGARQDGALPDFTALRAMLFYIDEFPEQRHHRKESSVLFPKLRARTPLARRLLDRLDEEHARGERNVRDLQHALLAFEMLGNVRAPAFERAVDLHTAFYLEHMALEERNVLPLAQEVLEPDDWAELDAAFSANRDPLTGHAPEPAYCDLFARIAHVLPRRTEQVDLASH